MPAKVVNKQQLMNKMKMQAKGAWARARTVVPEARGSGGLPPGLDGAVGICKAYKFDATEKKGDPYFSLQLVVVEPAELIGKKGTAFWFMNKSEYQTLDEAYANLSNDLQLMGKEMPEDLAKVTNLFKELCDSETAVIFKTSTPRKAGNMPKVFIQGLAEGSYELPAEGEGGGDAGDAGGEGDDQPADDQQEGDGGDSGDAGAEVEAPEGDPDPQKDDQFYYRINSRSEKKLCTVTSVNTKKQTVTLKREDDDKVFKDIPWAKLEGE